MGELIANYLYCIESCYMDVDNNCYSFLEYLGYRMNGDGLFKLSYRQFCSYGEDYFGDIYKAKLELLKKDKFINDVIRFNIVNTTYVDIEYVHQNYRDFFAASYLKNIITDDFSGVNINTVFGENFISPEVLILLGDILGEYKCINGGNSQIQEAVKIMGLKPMAVAQLVNLST